MSRSSLASITASDMSSGKRGNDGGDGDMLAIMTMGMMSIARTRLGSERCE